MGIHQGRCQQPSLGIEHLSSAGRGLSCSIAADCRQPPRLNQHIASAQLSAFRFEQLNLMQQQRLLGVGGHRAPAAVRSRTPPRWAVWFKHTTTGAWSGPWG